MKKTIPILISSTQRKNKLIEYLRIPYNISDDILPADYSLGEDAGVLFLSLKYHQKNRDYIVCKLNELSKHKFKARILLLLVDTKQYEEKEISPENDDITQLTVLCMEDRYSVTVLLAFSYEECSRWIISLYTSQNSTLDILKPSEESNLNIAIKLLNSLGISKNIAKELIMKFETLENIFSSSVDTIVERMPNINRKQVEAMYAGLREEF